MKNLIQKVLEKKLLYGTIALVLIGAGYFGYSKIFSTSGPVRYVAAQAQKGTLVVSISGSGQVSASDQADIKPKVSGDIVWAGVAAGQDVRAGQALFSIDDQDIRKQVADAEQALSDAKDNYDQVTTDVERTLKNAYDDGFSNVSTSFFKLSGYMKDLQDVLGTEKSEDEYVASYKLILGPDSPFIQKLLDDYDQARNLYTQNFLFFRDVSQGGDRDTVYRLIGDTLETTKEVSYALESARHMYDAITTKGYTQYFISSTIDKMKPKIESDVSSVYSQINTLQNIKNTIDDTNTNTPKNILSAKNTIRNKQDALDTLNEQRAEHTVRAPFSGVIAKVNSKNGDTISSGTVLAALITKQNVVNVFLNEIDVAKVKTGQKATMTFDAVPDLTIAGTVADVDMVGTVSQGVVTYSVKIAFDTQDDRVKTAMSASAAIITDAVPDVLLVPNSALKSQGGTHYVEVVENEDQSAALAASAAGAVLKNAPRRQPVEIGAASDEFTEITSGLNEGDVIVTRTIQPTTAQSVSTAQSSSIRIPGLPTGGGNSRGNAGFGR